MEYNEDDAIKYIRDKVNLPSEIDDDEVLNIIDMIFDYYEDHGLLEINADIDDDNELDTAALLAYVTKMVSKDKASPLSPSDVEGIVKAELDYEDSIDEF